MDGRAEGGALLEYRLEQVEKRLVEVGKSVHELRDALQPITASRRRYDDVMATVQLDIEKLQTKQDELDGEFKKYFNRGIGIVSVLTVMWALIGGYAVKRLSDFDAVVTQLPTMSAALQQQTRTQRAILKRLGVDPDLIPPVEVTPP